MLRSRPQLPRSKPLRRSKRREFKQLSFLLNTAWTPRSHSPSRNPTREATVNALREQLELHRIQSASLDNDATRRAEMVDRTNAIQLLLEFLQKKEEMQ